MTLPIPAAGPASRSGVRRNGDHYQDLVTWVAALRLIQPHSEFSRLDIEINGVGNVDDIVLRRPVSGDHFTQVKWATATSSIVDDKFLTQRKPNGKSVLEKFFASYQLLRDDSRPPRLELLTNRALDTRDPLLSRVDGRTDLLVPHARQAQEGTPAGKQLLEWAAHVGTSRDDLLEMLDHLAFRTAFTVGSERDRAQALMVAAGLRHDDIALDQGIEAAGKWVRSGRRSIEAPDLQQEVSALGLTASCPHTILLIQAIDRDPHPEDAMEVLDWVDLYGGDSPMTRAQPANPEDWGRIAEELQAAVTRLQAQGAQNVLVRGAMRQATFFLTGAQLAQVTGRSVSCVQHGVLWSSNAPRVPVPPPAVERHRLGMGSDLAVAVGVAVDPTAAVAGYLKGRTDIAELITITPQGGAHDQAVAGAGQAVAYAQAIRNSVRLELESVRAERIHLFLAGPGGLALLLGHRWNRLAPTSVYEHLGPGRGYAPAFDVPA